MLACLLVTDGFKANVINVSMSEIIPRSTDSNIKFPGEVRPLRIPPVVISDHVVDIITINPQKIKREKKTDLGFRS